MKWYQVDVSGVSGFFSQLPGKEFGWGGTVGGQNC